MKAAVFLDFNKMELQELPQPQPGPDEVVLKVNACGVCGTDSHIYSGELRVARPPVVLGHEISGTIVEVGKNVTSFQPGQTVSLDPVIACGTCEFCHIGRPNLCANQTTIGYVRNGGFAQYTVVPATHVYPISEKVGAKGGILVETLACVLNGFDRLELKAGKSVMILGAGTVGLLWNQVIKHTLSTFLIQTELVDFRRNLARELGADKVINPQQVDLAEEVYSVCPEGVDYIIDATGDPQAVEQAIPLVRKSGTFMIFGVCPEEAEIKISPFLLYQKEMKIIASKMPPQTLDRSARLLEAGFIDVDKIVNLVLPLEKTAEAFDMFVHARDKVVKMAIDPWMR
ncbi:MAG: zinc-dependent alcohol dehydrogenase family protein [candidate division KSB1 bacterium]|nr:zinc-dependent alcohol dehydrogenase family protein [candidate division KSB1 bacterium]